MQLRIGRQHVEQETVRQLRDRPLPAAAEKDARLRGDRLEIRHGQRVRVAIDPQRLPAFRAQPAADRRRERRHLVRPQPDQPARHEVERVRTFRRQQTPDRPRGALRRPVALHADHGVADAQPRLTVFAQIDDHVRKILDLRVFVVIFRLHRAGNDAEKVLDGVRHAHHPVRLELAHVDDRVRVSQICRLGEAPCLHGLRIRDRADGKIPVQLRTQRLGRAQTRHVVDALQMRGVVQPAGAVAEDDVRPVRLQHPHQRTDHRRMDRRGLLRLHRGDQIQLQRHAHPGRDPVQPARGRDSRLQRGRDLRILIALTGGEHHIIPHSGPSRCSEYVYSIMEPPELQRVKTAQYLLLMQYMLQYLIILETFFPPGAQTGRKMEGDSLWKTSISCVRSRRAE